MGRDDILLHGQHYFVVVGNSRIESATHAINMPAMGYPWSPKAPHRHHRTRTGFGDAQNSVKGEKATDSTARNTKSKGFDCCRHEDDYLEIFLDTT